jgi:hypothetical protein
MLAHAHAHYAVCRAAATTTMILDRLNSAAERSWQYIGAQFKIEAAAGAHQMCQ